MRHEIIHGDNMDVLPTLPADSIDSMVTDPPAGIAFMGKAWDSHSRYEPRTVKGKVVLDGATLMGLEPWEAGFVSFTTDWSTEAFRVLKPGAHALVWALPRTSDLTELGLRAVGFEIREIVTHLFGSGFPKSLNVSKAIDDFLGAERPVVGEKDQRNPYIGSDGLQFRDAPDYTGKLEAITAPGSEEAARFDGWGTALKPASEHWILCRKPLGEDTVAANVLKYGTGAINVGECRVEYSGATDKASATPQGRCTAKSGALAGTVENDGERGDFERPEQMGRFPANLVLTHHPDCKRVGTARVPASPPASGPTRNGESTTTTRGKFNGAPDSADRRDAGGMETVEAWECVEGCPVKDLDEQSGPTGSFSPNNGKSKKVHGTGDAATFLTQKQSGNHYGDYGGGASRFFPQFAWTDDDMNTALFLYCAKASRSERNAKCEALEERDMLWSSGTQNPGSFQAPGTNRKARNFHPTVKPIELMRWLLRLITPPGGTALDPFLGSGTTMKAAIEEGFDCIGIEREADYVAIARARTQGDQLRLFG